MTCSQSPGVGEGVFHSVWSAPAPSTGRPLAAHWTVCRGLTLGPPTRRGGRLVPTYPRELESLDSEHPRPLLRFVVVVASISVDTVLNSGT